jgi:hypothetical protein
VDFASPSWLFALPAALIPLLLGFLRLPPRRTRVPSLLVWRQLRERTPPMREMRRPRLSPALILSALAVASGVLALSRPSVGAISTEPRDAILVIDTGARMLTRHPDGRTSFEHAIAVAVKRLQELEARDRVHLIAPGAPVRTLERDAAIRALSGLRAGRARVDRAALAARARELRAARPDAAILALSDRPVAGLATSRTGVAASDNVGIAGLAVEEETLFVRLVNAGPARSVRISIQGAVEEVTVPAGDSALLRPRRAGASLEAAIQTPDNLALDDVARATRLPGRAALTVSYRGRKREDLLRVLTLLPGVRVVEGDADPADAWVVCEAVPDAARPRVLIAVAPPPGEIPPFRIGDPVSPTRLAFRAEHPAIREILYAQEELRVQEPREVALPEGASALITAEGKPICAILEGADQFTLAMAFDPFSTSWSKHSSFAVFFAAVFEQIRRWLGGESVRVLVAGEPADLGAIPGLRHLEGEAAAAASGAVVAEGVGVARFHTDLGPFEAHFNLLRGEVSLNAGEWEPSNAPLFDGRRSTAGTSRPLEGGLTFACLLLALAAFVLERRARLGNWA